MILPIFYSDMSPLSSNSFRVQSFSTNMHQIQYWNQSHFVYTGIETYLPITVDLSRPDILIIEKKGYKIDIPLIYNRINTIEIKRVWNIETFHIIPFVIFDDGIVNNNITTNIHFVSLPKHLTFTMLACQLRNSTCNISSLK